MVCKIQKNCDDIYEKEANSLKAVRKKRWSLVRFLASCVPSFLWEYFFPVPPRMYISPHFLQNISALKENNSPSDDSNTSFCSFKQNFHKKNLQLMLNSTPKRKEDLENHNMKALLVELDEIKKMVARLVEKQSEQCSGYGTLSKSCDHLHKSFTSQSPPVPPPPPPPPLPNFSLVPVNSPIKIEKKKRISPPQVSLQQSKFPCGEELLKDLKKVQLKKIEKSPGGGPLKKPKNVLNDPGDFLAAVLKKRFGCVQNSPDSSIESPSVDAENSFGSGIISSSYKIEQKSKIAVL